MNPISSDLDQSIRQVLRSCGRQAEQMAAKPFEVFQKGPEDYFTSIDSALDQQLSAAFSEYFPQDGVITEENPDSKKAFTAKYSRLWCIDPLDGTEEFIRHKHDYAVMVGLLQDFQPIAGWIYAPVSDQTFSGGVNWGVFQAVADQPLHPLTIVEPAPPTDGFCPVIIGHRDQVKFGAAIARLIPEIQFYSLGSFGLKVMEVIQGNAGLYVYFNGRVKVWDTAGPLALAQAAGLVCCDLQGQPISFLPQDIDPVTLAHRQPILVGWPKYIDLLLPKLQAAIGNELKL